MIALIILIIMMIIAVYQAKAITQLKHKTDDKYFKRPKMVLGICSCLLLITFIMLINALI